MSQVEIERKQRMQNYLKQYKTSIDFIIGATEHDPNDEEIRLDIAMSIARALSMSSKLGRTDEVSKNSKETAIYKLAACLSDSFFDYMKFRKRVVGAFPQQRSNEKPVYLLLKRFKGIDWKYTFEIPESDMPRKYKTRGSAGKPTTPSTEEDRPPIDTECSSNFVNVKKYYEEYQGKGFSDDDALLLAEYKDMSPEVQIIRFLRGICTLESKVMQLENENKRLKDQFKNHVHMPDGRAVVVTEI